MDDDLDLVVAFRNEAATLYKAARTITGDISVLGRISKNRLLFMLLHQKRAAYRYIGIDPARALDVTISPPSESIVLHVVDLGLYLTVDEHGYKALSNVLYNTISNMAAQPGMEGLPEPEFALYQLVISSKAQKFIFAFTRPDLYERMVRHAKACFGEHVSVDTARDQVRIGIEVTGDLDIITQFNKLFVHIVQAHDMECVTAMGPVPPMSCSRHIYREYVHEPMVSMGLDLADCLKCMRSATHVTVMINAGAINTGTGNVTVHMRDNMQHGPPAGDLDAAAQQWVRNNPPGTKEGAQDYFNKYKAANTPALDIKAFRRVVIGAGYEPEHTSRANIWKRKATVQPQ